MKKYYSFLLLILCSMAVMAQNTVGVLQNTEDSFNGYTLFSPRTSLSPNFTYLVDNCGQIVHQWESELPVFSTDYLMPDGSLYRSIIDNQSTLSLPGTNGRVEHVDWDGNLIWGITYSDTDFSFHHDFVVLPNGNLLLTVAHRRTGADAIEEGRDPASLTEGELYEERIIEIEPIGTDDFNIVWEWRSWDHLIQDFDSTKNNFGVIEDNPQRIDVNFGDVLFGVDWWHTNSLSYSPELDQIILSNLGFNEFIIIDHSTTTAEAAGTTGGNSNMGGDILYRWGNPQSYDRGDSSDQVFNGQHNVQFIPPGLPNEGKIIAFSNNHTPTSSRIVILTPTFDTTSNTYPIGSGPFGPENVDFEYQDPVDPDNFHSSFISGVQQLENGNIFICSGAKGRLFEVDVNANTVWEYRNPVAANQILADGENPDDFSTLLFRALRYAPDYPAFEGRDLTPQGVIETNPVADDCELLDVTENRLTDITIYPNPTENTITVSALDIAAFEIDIYNTQGQMMMSKQNEHILDVSYLQSGIYFLKITDGRIVKTLKFIKK